MIVAFRREFAKDIPEEAGVDFDEWLYEKINYYQNDNRRSQKWKMLYNEHYNNWRTEVDDKFYLTQKNARIREREAEYFAIPDKYADKVLKTEAEEIIVYRRNTEAKLKVLRHIQEELAFDPRISRILDSLDFENLDDEYLQRIHAGENPLAIAISILLGDKGRGRTGNENPSEGNREA